MSGQTVCPGHFTARDKALVVIELEAGWVLELVWMFWKKDRSFAAAKIWNHRSSVVHLIHCTDYAAAC